MSSETGLNQKTVECLHAVLRKHPAVQSAILYGSRALGTFKAGSDIDLTLIAPTWSTSELLSLENEIDDLLLPYKVDLSLRHQIQNTDLLEHIERAGKLFYSK
jgi:predicted nucleotidyltransferase